MKTDILKTWINFLIISLFFSCENALPEYDLIVYGGTPSGVIASYAAAREGAKVLLIEQTGHIGGLNTSGLGTAESEHMIDEVITGYALDFYKRVGRKYGKDTPAFYFEPHIAEETFNEMMRESGVEIILNRHLTAVDKQNGMIKNITLDDGLAFRARYFIDATYEGDLMASSNVSYTYGREPVSQYNEPLAGIRLIDGPTAASPYDEEENLLPRFTEVSALTEGEGDKRVMNYNFRLTFSNDPDNMRPFTEPANYNPDDFILLKRFLGANPDTKLNDILDIYPFRDRMFGKHGIDAGKNKFEINNRQNAIISIGFFGGNADYPDAGYETRRQIYQEHKEYTQGLLYFLSHDPSVPEELRNETQSFGLAKDEYADNGNWPYYLYVREARRMTGPYIFRQQDILEDREKPDAICLGSHWIDSHHVQRVALSDSTFTNEGRIWLRTTEPFDLPYRMITPQESECTNLLVPVCVSASHVGFCVIRLESTWMQLGHAAGIAAVLALKEDQAVQAVSIDRLKQELEEGGMIVSLELFRKNYPDFAGADD